MKTVISIPLFLLSMTAGASCPTNWPAVPPGVPDGMRASKVEMYRAQESIKTYIDEAREYLDCKSANDLRRDRVAVQLERVADSYNEELKAFREKS